MLKYIRADLPHGLGGDPVSPEAFTEIITELSGAGMDIFSARHADASGESAVCENGKGVQFFRICLKCLADKKMRVLQRIGKWNAVAQIVLHFSVVDKRHQGGSVLWRPGSKCTIHIQNSFQLCYYMVLYRETH